MDRGWFIGGAATGLIAAYVGEFLTMVMKNWKKSWDVKCARKSGVKRNENGKPSKPQ